MSAVDQAREAPWQPRHNPWAIALVVTLAAFMEILDTTIVNVALPHIAGSLSTSNRRPSCRRQRAGAALALLCLPEVPHAEGQPRGANGHHRLCDARSDDDGNRAALLSDLREYLSERWPCLTGYRGREI
jgi:hypothetical protein